MFLLFRLDATPPPRAPCEPQVCVFPLYAVFFFLQLLMLTYLHFFLLLFPFSISIWTSFVSILSFSCGYYEYVVSSVSVSAATRLDLQGMIYMNLDTYVRWSHFFILVWGTSIRFVSVIVCIIFRFCFPPEVILRSRVIGACPMTTDCIVATVWVNVRTTRDISAHGHAIAGYLRSPLWRHGCGRWINTFNHDINKRKVVLATTWCLTWRKGEHALGQLLVDRLTGGMMVDTVNFGLCGEFVKTSTWYETLMAIAEIDP